MPDIRDKDSYAELTDKQQAVVDEYVEDPTAQNTEIAERADVSRSTVYNVKQKYGHILESKLNERGRDPGEEKTEGDPFAGALETERGYQTIADRPHQPDRDGDDADGETAVLRVALPERVVWDVLEKNNCEAVRAVVVEALVNRAFDADDE